MLEKRQCFWCRQEIGAHGIEYQDGAVLRSFHRGLLRDCMNEFLKWKSSHQPNVNYEILNGVCRERR